MFLSHVHVENFRGIQRLDLELADNIILIGENAVGKTSLLELLAICLSHRADGGEFGFEESDFHVPRESQSGLPLPIRVAITFREREAGEWDRLQKLESAIVVGDDGVRQLTLEVRAVPGTGVVPNDATAPNAATAPNDATDPNDGTVARNAAATVDWAFLGIDGQPLDPKPDSGLLAQLRELSPFLLMRSDRYFPLRRARADDEGQQPGGRQRHEEIELEAEIARVYERIISSERPTPASELRKGLAAVGKLLGEHADRVFQNPEAPERCLEELVERPVVLSIDAGPRLDTSLQGGGARSVALLLLVGALLEARGPTTMSADAEMILAIEEPEVHLHPLMLAAVWSVVESLRAQKLVTTNSGELMSAARLQTIRRLVRRSDRIEVFQLRPETLTLEERRKITYHMRLKRDDTFFARCWLLVEGETEVWLLPELARLMGHDFASEGVHVVEFAQSGVQPLVKVANDLGIEWHLVTDGDAAGKIFADVARKHLRGAPPAERITSLEQPDMEHCLWHSGYAYVYHSIARGRTEVLKTSGKKSKKSPGKVIERAIRATSKPYLALAVLEQVAEEDSPGIPPVLRSTIERALEMARSVAPAR